MNSSNLLQKKYTKDSRSQVSSNAFNENNSDILRKSRSPAQRMFPIQYQNTPKIVYDFNKVSEQQTSMEQS